MAFGLGLGRLRLGARRGGAAAVPAFATNPAISGTPLIGTAVAPGEFTYTGTEPVTPTYQWKRAGVDIAGATSATFTETVDATAYGKLLSRVTRLTNAAGFVEYETTAPAVTGRQFSEDFSAYADLDTITTLEVLFSRTSTATSANVLADAAAPGGKAINVVVSTSADRPMYRDDMAAFATTNSAETDYVEALYLSRHKLPAGGRYGFRGWNATGGANSVSTDFGPFFYDTGNNIWLQVTADKDTNGGTSLGADLVADSIYFWRVKHDALGVYAKVWLASVPEPSAWTFRSATVPYTTITPAFGGRNVTTTPGTVHQLQYFSGGFNAPAPFHSTYVAPVSVSTDPMSYAAAASGAAITAFDGLITFNLTAASTLGRYFGGWPFCTRVSGVTQILSAAPASAVLESYQRHGMEFITTRSYDGTTGSGPTSQGFDARPVTGYLPTTYDGALNIDPGKTGSALTITTPGTLIKSAGLTNAAMTPGKAMLDARAPLFMIDHTPATNALPPPIGASPLVSLFTEANVNIAGLSAFAKPDSALAEVTAIDYVRWLHGSELSLRSKGDFFTGQRNENSYGSDQAKRVAEAMLMLSLNTTGITDGISTKKLLATFAVIHAQNTCQALEAGARFNYNSGLGGILAGHKIMVVIAACLTGDSWLTSWAQRTDWAAEDRQLVHVTQSQVDTYDYIQDDLAMPEWMQNPVRDPASNTRITGASYRTVNMRHLIGQAIAVDMIPGGRAKWNNPAFFNYADRTMQRTFYKDPASTNQWARTLTGTNSPSTFQKAVWDAQRAGTGTAIWNWPA